MPIIVYRNAVFLLIAIVVFYKSLVADFNVSVSKFIATLLNSDSELLFKVALIIEVQVIRQCRK